MAEVISTKMSEHHKSRIASSAAIETDWNSVAPVQVAKLVSTCADGLGASTETFFFPFLSAAAAMMGRNAMIALNDFWFEPAIIWTAVVADDACRKKSAVQHFIVNSVKDALDLINNEQAQQLFNAHDHVITSGPAPTLVQICDTDFSMCTLKARITEGSRECLLISKDLQRVYNKLEANDVSDEGFGKGSSSSSGCKHKETFFELLSGYSPWTDENDAIYSDSRFNLTGFVHPRVAMPMIDGSSPESRGFLENTAAIVCPQPRKVYHKQSFGSTGPVLAPILLKLRQVHASMTAYTLDDEANAAFGSYYNDVEERLDRMTSEELSIRRMLSKSQGQVARIALVLHCLNHVSCHVSGHDQSMAMMSDHEVIPKKISADVMYNAINLMRLCIRRKLELMNPATIKSGISMVPPVIPSPNQTSAISPRVSQNPSPRLANDNVQPERLVVQNTNRVQMFSGVTPVSTVNIIPRQVPERRVSDQVIAVSAPVMLTNNLPKILPKVTSQPQQIYQSPSNMTPITQPVVFPQGPRFPVGVSVEPGGPHIVQVTYTPQGSNTPVNAGHQPANVRNLIPLKRAAAVMSSGMSSVRPVKPKLALSGDHRLKPLKPLKPSPVSSLSMPPRPSSRMSPSMVKIFGRRVQKKLQSNSSFPVTSKYPTSMDYQNFHLKCPRKAKRILTLGRNQLEACYVAQRKLFPPILDGPSGLYKYPTNAARAFLTAIADAGLGEMVSRTGSRSGKSTFRKKRFEDLTPGARDILGQLEVTQGQYSYVDV